MKIVMTGVGYVGLVTGVCFAEFGHSVVCLDTDQEKVDKMINGVMPIDEPRLDELVGKNVEQGQLLFSTNLSKFVPSADAIFVSAGTQMSQDGNQYANLQCMQATVREFAKYLDPAKYVVVVDKGDVPGGERQIARIISDVNSLADFDIASNPDFLYEGDAINDFIHRDHFVLGVGSNRAGVVLQEIYSPLSSNISLMYF